MFQEDPHMKKAVEKVLKHVEKIGRGHMLTWAVISEMTGYHPKAKDWGRFQTKIRKGCLSRFGISVQPCHGVGYYLPKPGDQILEAPERRGKKARRQIFTGLKESRGVNVEELNKTGATHRANVISSLKTGYAAVNAHVKAVQAISKPTVRGRRVHRVSQ